MKKKVAIYCRVATTNQLETSQTAEQSQQKYLLQFANEHQLEVTAIYSNIGFTGHDLNRPAYTRMIAAARKGCFNAINYYLQLRRRSPQTACLKAIFGIGKPLWAYPIFG